MKLLEITGLNHSFLDPAGNELAVLRDIDLSLDAGELLAIVGPSGCGKSTLLRILAGLTKPDSVGSLIWRGEKTNLARLADQIAWLPQNCALLPWLSVLDNIALPITLLHKANKQKAHTQALELLANARLAEFAEARPATLSGGMAARVAFLRTLATGRPLFLLDEPFAALDAINREFSQNWLQDIWQQNSQSGILITHSLSEAVMLADRVIVMGQRGQQIVETVPIELARPRTAEVRDSAEFTALVARLRARLAESF